MCVITNLQVTQQTIRVPMGYPLPGMQLHVVAGHANAQQYAHFARQQQLTASVRPGYGYVGEKPAVKYTERGAPEGAASVSQSDCNNSLVSPTSGVQSSANNTQTTTTTTAPGVFYAMNV